MVATRKSLSNQSAPPAASRTNSATSSPKIKPRKSGSLTTSPSSSMLPPAPGVAIAGKKDSLGPEFADPPKVIGSTPLKNSVSSNSISPSPSPSRPTGKSSRQKKPTAKATSPRTRTSTPVLLKLIRNAIATGFLAHALLVCPYDSALQSAVCSTVHDFQSYSNYFALEPYLRPYFDQFVSHPSVSPYTQPVIRQTHRLVGRVKPVLVEFGARINRFYLTQLGKAEKVLRHYSLPWIERFYQQYETSLHPFVDKHLLPPYKAYLLPTLHGFDKYGKIAGMHAEPYFHRVVVATREVGQKLQPHAMTVVGYAAQVPRMLHQHAWEPLMDARRTYVDPPISKIMETVEEAGGEAKAATSSRFAARADEVPGEQQVFEGAPISENSLDEVIPSEAFSSTRTPSSPATDVKAEHVTPTPLDAGFATESTPGTTSGPDDEDLAAFLRELGEDEPAAEPKAVPEPQHTETPEEAEQRLRLRAAETAEMRAGIVARHDEWERKVKAMSVQHVAALPDILREIRAEAIAALQEAEHADAIQMDAAKSLKNTEAFVKKLVAETSGPEVKTALLENVVNKVKKKFEDGASKVSDGIKTWWEYVRQAESEEVEKLVQELRDLGSIAQKDIGLDYAYLDDVTHQDWTRYHTLLGAANDLDKKLKDMVLGVDEDSPENALSDALSRLQVDLETVVRGFQTSLRNTHQKGLDAILGRQTQSGTSSVAAPEPAPAAAEDGRAEEPTFSVLPIKEPLHSDAANPHIFVGKSKEQVEEALRMAHAAELQAKADSASAAPAATEGIHVEL